MNIIKSYCRVNHQFKVFIYSCLIILLLSNLYLSYGLDIEDIIPTYSKSCVIVRNLPDIYMGIKSSPSWKIFLSSENITKYNQKMDNLKKWINTALDPELEKLDLMNYVQEIAFVNLGIGFNVNSGRVIIVDTGNSENTSQALQIIEYILTNYEIQKDAGVYEKVPFGIAKHKEEKSTLIYAQMENLFVFASDQDTFETLVDVYSGKEPSIIYDPKFNRTRAEIPDDGNLFAYINMELFWLTDNQKPYESLFFRILGADEIKSIAWNIDLLKPDVDQDSYLYIGEGQGLLASIPIEPEQMLSTHIIPASNADIFFTMNLGDLVSVWETLNRASNGMANIATAEFEKDTGLNLKNDLLSSLTGEIGFAGLLPKATELINHSNSILENEFLLFFQVKDSEKLKTSIEKILASDNKTPQKMSYKGVDLYSLPTMKESEIPSGYMFADDLLIFGNFQIFGKIIDGELPLIASEKFIDLSSKLPQNTRMMYYLDINRFADILLMITSSEKNLEDDLTNMFMSGLICGGIASDGEGLKIKTINDSGAIWLDNIGYLAILYALMKN